MTRDCSNDCGVVDGDGYRAAVKPWEEGEFRVFGVNQGGCADALAVRDVVFARHPEVYPELAADIEDGVRL